MFNLIYRLHFSTEALLEKLATFFEQVIDSKQNDLKLNIEGLSMIEYLRTFKWELAKYPLHQSITTILELIKKQIIQTDSDVNRMKQDYLQVCNDLEYVEKKQEGSLFQKNLSFIVDSEHFVLDSKYLMTALVVVQKSRYPEWYNCYERLDREVVPRSSYLLLEDNENGLFTVTLFKRHFQLIKERAKELNFLVRDFIYDEEEIEQEKINLLLYQLKKKKMYEPLLKWINVNFSETYVALAHIKVLQIATECVLRYGLPPNFFAVLITFPKKAAKKLVNGLANEYDYIDESLKSLAKSQIENDDYPFVYFKIIADISNIKRRL